jgi:hypothetical protein
MEHMPSWTPWVLAIFSLVSTLFTLLLGFILNSMRQELSLNTATTIKLGEMLNALALKMAEEYVHKERDFNPLKKQMHELRDSLAPLKAYHELTLLRKKAGLES